MVTGNRRRPGRLAPTLPLARLLGVPSLGLGTFGLGALVLAFFCACGSKHPTNEPVDDINDACCKVANDDMTKFAGCRPTGRCAKDEPIWMRGYIKCTAVEEERCAGGRCCEYRPMYGSPDAVLHWDDSSGEEPAADAQSPGPQTTPEAAPQAGPQTTPEAAPQAGPQTAPEAAATPAAAEIPTSSEATPPGKL